MPAGHTPRLKRKRGGVLRQTIGPSSLQLVNVLSVQVETL